MGNETNCQRFCDHKQQENIHEMSSEIKMNQYPLQCQICQKQVQHTEFKNHLQLYHFANIEEKNYQIWVICLLCQKNFNNLTEHKSHLLEKHFSLFQYFKSSQITPQQTTRQAHKNKVSVKQINSKIKQIDAKNKVKKITQTQPNKWNVQYQKQLFQMTEYSKQYNGMDYDDSQVYSELVLTPILLNSLQQPTYYFIDKTPLDKTIFCVSYILAKTKNYPC